MTLYELDVDATKFRAVEPVSDDDDDLFMKGFRGQPMADTWTSPEVRFVDDEFCEHQVVGDFPHLFGAVPVMSARAVEALHSVLEPCGELLPLGCEVGEYWAYNCLAVVDAMDTQRSTADYLAPDRIVVLRRFVPRVALDMELAPIFKLPQWLAGSPLITDVFVDIVVQHGLRGLDPRPLASQQD